MISVDGLAVEFGGTTLFSDISFVINEKDRIALMGKNGAGKSTLLKILAGVRQPTRGKVSAPKECVVAYLPQHLMTEDGRTVFDETAQAFAHLHEMEAQIEKLNKELETRTDYESDSYMALIEEVSSLSEKYYSIDATNYEEDVEKALLGLGFRREDFGRQTSDFSGGWRMRIELAKLLLQKPDVLLLDEPTNHLDAESVEWLEQYLHRFPGTVVAVTHDRYFLDNAAEWILELDRGEGIPWKGNYSSWLDQKEKRLEMEKRQNEARSKAIAHELEWVRQNPKGRQAKSKARLAHFEELSSYEYQERNETNEIFIPVADRLGKSVIEFEHVSKGFGDKLLIDDLSFVVPQGAIVGVIGPNGAGKSTLFRMITGKQQPDSGKITIGSTVKLAAVDQMRSSLPNDKTVFEAISDGLDIIQVGKFEMPARSYIGRFNFKGQDQQKRVGDLSGGERGRLHLAKTLLAGGNVLLLDEPSNDLDVETLRALEDALLEFPGCAMVTSHDRWFLDRIATHILAFEGDSKVVFFPGNYQEYEADKKKRLGEAAAAPHRLRFKPLKH